MTDRHAWDEFIRGVETTFAGRVLLAAVGFLLLRTRR